MKKESKKRDDLITLENDAKTNTKHQKIRASLVILGLFLVVVIFSIFGGLYYFYKNYVIVPNLVGMDGESAFIEMKNSQLKNIIETKVVEDKNIGRVIEQSYAGKLVKKKTEVLLTIGVSEEKVIMVNLIGDNVTTAIDKLNDLGLQYKIVNDKNYDLKEYYVSSQSIPKDTEVNKGTVVEITVANTKEENNNEEEPNSPNNNQSNNSSNKENNSNQESGSNSNPSTKPNNNSNSGTNTNKPNNNQNNTNPSTNNNQNTTPSTPKNWSQWVEKLPNGVTDKNYIIETKKQYSYRTKETTESTSSKLDGWILDYSSSVVGYDEADMHTEVIQSRDYTKFKERTDIHIYSSTAASNNVSLYFCLKKNSDGSYSDSGVAPNSDYSCPSGYVQYIEKVNAIAEYPYETGNVFSSYCSQYKLRVKYVRAKINSVSSWRVKYYLLSDKKTTVKYHYHRWTNWSSYQDAVIYENSNTEVRERTLYRYKEK